jgi:hypothetical protein
MSKEELKNRIRDLLREKRTERLSDYERKRLEFSERVKKGYEPSTAQLLNFLEGLTADGYNKLGQKVRSTTLGEPTDSASRLFFREKFL